MSSAESTKFGELKICEVAVGALKIGHFSFLHEETGGADAHNSAASSKASE